MATGPGLPTNTPIVDSAVGGLESFSSANPFSETRSTENQALAAALELQSQLDRCDSHEEACKELALSLLSILQATRVFVIWRSEARSPMRLVADTDEVSNGLESNSVVDNANGSMLIASGEELCVLNETFEYHTDIETPRGIGTRTLQQMARTIRASSLTAVNLVEDAGDASGGIFVVDSHADSTRPFLETLSPVVTSRLSAIERLQPGWIESYGRTFVQSLREYQGWRTATIACVGVILLLFLPATYTVAVPFELQPVTRRFVAVPFDGPLKSCRVRPGDVVKEGEVLAEIDPREIQYELAGVRSQWEQADQTRKGKIAEQDFAAGKMAELESRRLSSQSQILLERESNLEIRSPVAGMVVSGDWRSNEGMPLSRGETLFEIAPLEEMVVELWIKEAEISHIRIGMPVQLATNADPDAIHVGTLCHIHPAAEIRGHDNVFVAEVRIANPDGILQPGMRGHATVYADKHTIAWNWLHRPWHALRDLGRW